jgi:hypothetical protein
MQEFIQQAMQSLGTSEATTKAATGGLLDLVSKNAPPTEVSQLFDKLPGARELMASAAPAAPAAGAVGGGGMLGGLGGAVSGLAGAAGAGGGIIAMLTQSGLSLANAPQFLSLFVGFAKAKAGPGLVDKIMASVPGLAGNLA